MIDNDVARERKREEKTRDMECNLKSSETAVYIEQAAISSNTRVTLQTIIRTKWDPSPA